MQQTPINTNFYTQNPTTLITNTTIIITLYILLCVYNVGSLFSHLKGHTDSRFDLLGDSPGLFWVYFACSPYLCVGFLQQSMDDLSYIRSDRMLFSQFPGVKHAIKIPNKQIRTSKQEFYSEYSDLNSNSLYTR